VRLPLRIQRTRKQKFVFGQTRCRRARDIETYVIHPTVSDAHRGAKTDRLDTGLLKMRCIGWLRGEPDHCRLVAIPRRTKRVPSAQSVSARGWYAKARAL
jgi:hypothetical protein